MDLDWRPAFLNNGNTHYSVISINVSLTLHLHITQARAKRILLDGELLPNKNKLFYYTQDFIKHIIAALYYLAS